jgi:hypothetical protein
METDPLAALHDDLGEDLRTLVQRRDVPVRAIEPLVSRESPDRTPRAFRVRYADGQTCKVVRCFNATQAARVAAISRRLDAAAFAPVLDHAGAALLTPWVEGVPLDSGWEIGDVQRAGRILAALHAVAVPDDAPASDTLDIDRYTALLKRDLAILAREAAIAEDEAQALLALARSHAPTVCAVAVIHRDVCAENLVRQPSGALCVVDVETLTIGASDYDLARTWYRWPMPPHQRQALFDAYAAHGGRPSAWCHFPYWTICATAASAALRLLQGSAGAGIPLRRLRALHRHVAAGGGGHQLALQG